MTKPSKAHRTRLRIAVALAITIGLGLASRSGNDLIPAWIRIHAGDALWASAVYLSLAFVATHARARTLLWSALAISLAVELSQLWQIEWLDQARRTLPGRLLLGQGWEWIDLPRYAVGALLAFTLDCSGLFRRAGSAGDA